MARQSQKKAIFTPGTFQFFRELGRNNHKEWMDANRDRYRSQVVEPLRQLLERLTPTVLKLHADFDVSGRTGTNFSRINRDIRFARDKSPYRTQMYLMFSDRNAEDGDDGQLYVGIGADGVTCGLRIYGDTRNSRLARVGVARALRHPQWLQRQARRNCRRFESYWYTAEKGEWTKHDGWPHRPEDWRRTRGWIVRRKMPAVAATRSDFVSVVSRIFRDLFPLYQFFSSSRWRP